MTHPGAFDPPTPVEDAWEALEALLISPSIGLLSEGDRHATILKRLLDETQIRGSMVHDAQIAALLIEHGVGEIITADEGIRRFRQLKVTDPFRR